MTTEGYKTLPANLKPNQLRALKLLLEGYSTASAGSEVGVSRQTISGWINGDEAFRLAYDQAREALHSATLTQLGIASSLALDQLRDLLENSDDDSVRLRAITYLLDRCVFGDR